MYGGPPGVYALPHHTSHELDGRQAEACRPRCVAVRRCCRRSYCSLQPPQRKAGAAGQNPARCASAVAVRAPLPTLAAPRAPVSLRECVRCLSCPMHTPSLDMNSLLVRRPGPARHEIPPKLFGSPSSDSSGPSAPQQGHVQFASQPPILWGRERDRGGAVACVTAEITPPKRPPAAPPITPGSGELQRSDLFILLHACNSRTCGPSPGSADRPQPAVPCDVPRHVRIPRPGGSAARHRCSGACTPSGWCAIVGSACPRAHAQLLICRCRHTN